MALPLLDTPAIGDHERVAVVNTRKDVGVRTVRGGIYQIGRASCRERV